ncbi:hypothetical protein ACIQWR_07610 [Streptomyces sp. NPDC098789]|uniref:TRADD-N-associated membrane domain-containing protein n=1 Tax=Streptomyces sp. NPDC098789 TaxID=3366098 RepID=UPI0038051A8C
MKEWFENEKQAKEILAKEQRMAARRRECAKNRRKRDWIGWPCVVLGLAVIAVAAYFGLARHHLLFLLCGAFYGTLLALIGLFVLSNKTVEIEMQSLADEEELMASKDKGPAIKSYLLFKQHQQELKRYYDQSLSHAAILFFTGIVCMLSGLAIVGAALYLLTRKSEVELSGQILIGALGAVSAILSNFIAVIFLKMFKTAAESLAAQHRQLTSIHFLHFGNLLAEKLTSKELRDDTLSAMCTSLAGALNAQQGGPGSPAKGAGPP